MLSVQITGTERRSNIVAAVNEGAEWRMFMPFGACEITLVALVGDDRFICVSKDSELCLMNWRTGEVIRRRSLSRRPDCMRVTRDSEFVVLHDKASYRDGQTFRCPVNVVRASDLETVMEADTVVWPETGERCDLQIIEEIFEDSFGRLMFTCCHGGPANVSSRHGFARLDWSDWTIRIEPIPDGAGVWRWPSPTGRFVVAQHLGMRSDEPEPGTFSVSVRGVPHREQSRNRHVVELWRTDPPRLISVIATRPSLEPEWIHAIRWEPDESAFWIMFGTRTAEFQRVGVDGKCSPVFSFRRLAEQRYPFVRGMDTVEEGRLKVISSEDSIFIQRAWCESDLPFRWIGQDEDDYRAGTRPYPPERMVKKFLAPSERRHVVTLEAFTRTAIEDALQRLTRDIRERLPSLLQEDVFEVAFKVGPRTITETTFFRRLVRDRVPVVAALRELLTTYLEVQPQALEANGLFAQIWGPEDQGALAPAMLALLLLDASAHDVFRDYLAKRDEHDVYVHVLMKRYIKAHKWRDLAMIKLGIYFALVVRGGGGIVYKGSALRDFGLLQAAERMIAPEQFAAEIMQEIDEFIAANPDLPDVGKGELLQVMRDSLETTQYGLETLAVILSRKYPMRSLDQNTLELLRYGGTMQ